MDKPQKAGRGSITEREKKRFVSTNTQRRKSQKSNNIDINRIKECSRQYMEAQRKVRERVKEADGDSR